jgi:SAM-dependent methyltransferase
MHGNVWGVQRAESVAAAMAVKSQEQLIQTRFRLDLVDGWDLPPGARVLEVGCGQGDMTAVLADAVGAGGRVLGVDNASPGYGAPVTLGQSAAYLSATPLGERIEFRFEFDVLNPASLFPDGAFDDVVLSQCSWYFAGLGQLRQTLARVRPWARRLCFAEWDLAASDLGQLPHLLAVRLPWRRQRSHSVLPAGVAGDPRRDRLAGRRPADGRHSQHEGCRLGGRQLPAAAC